MLARELYDRCDEKTRQIIQTYAYITYENSDSDGYLNYNLEINKKSGTNFGEQYLWNLLAVAVFLDDEIQEVIQPLMIAVEGKENFKDEILSKSKVLYVTSDDLYKEAALK